MDWGWVWTIRKDSMSEYLIQNTLIGSIIHRHSQLYFMPKTNTDLKE